MCLQERKGNAMHIKGFKECEVNSSKNVAEICYSILKKESAVDRDKEHFWSIGLDSQNKVKYVELVTLGLLNQVIIQARELYRGAIKEGGVLSLIITHNHPSGCLEPSPEDKAKTKELADAGKIIGIQLLDHLIIGKEGYYSFADEGLL